MAVIAEISLPSTDFVLGRLLSDETELEVEFERIVSLGTGIRPLFWARNGDIDAFERQLSRCDAVDQCAVLERFDDRALYTVTWKSSSNDFLYGLGEADAVALRARWCDNEQWRLKLLFPSHERLSAFHEFCIDNEIHCTLGRVYPLDESTAGRNVDSLTAEQREAILLALRGGYFDTPSRTTLSELATQLEISQQALSQRIRRGTKAVFEEIISVSDGA